MCSGKLVKSAAQRYEIIGNRLVLGQNDELKAFL